MIGPPRRPMQKNGRSGAIRLIIISINWAETVTNYASQCLYAGSGVMNFTPVTGWFYRTANDRTASWTGVEYFFRFLTENEGTGPFGEEAPLDELEIGDFVQLGNETGDFYHTPFVCGFSRGKILVAAHTFDAYNRPLSSYSYQRIRGVHFLGVRRGSLLL